MTNFTISDSELDAIKDQVVIVTGASSGIGLATTRRLIQHGVKVFASDINDLPEPEKSRVPFLKTDVSSWAQQVALFKAAKQKYGHINHVFANAGIAPKTTLLEDEVNENGDLLPPILTTININLIGVLYTVKLAVYHIKQSPTGGSIVMTGSGSSFARFSPTDYTTSKHGVYGILRSMYENLHPKLPIRINAVAPSWTDTSIVPRELIDVIGSDKVQSPDVVARSVVCLMADRERHGQMVYSDRGEFWDIETGENGLLAHTGRMLGGRESAPEQEALNKLLKLVEQKMEQGENV